MEYVRICRGLNDKGTLLPYNDYFEYIDDPEVAWFKSIYFYNDSHYNRFKETGSVAGITDVVTNHITFDLDSKTDLEQARKDAVELCSRLISKGILSDNIQICFSGSKGFSIDVETNSRFTPEEFKNINAALAGDLVTNDSVISNPSRIFRVPSTKHNVSGLYKIPLTLTQLSDLSVDKIKELSKSMDNIDPDNFMGWHEIETPNSLLTLKNTKPKPLLEAKPVYEEALEIDFSSKPKYLSNCKWALLHGYFKEGNRNNALMALAATLKGQGFPKEVVYKMLKGTLELQIRRYNSEPIDKSEIWNNVVNTVYKPTWNGATYSCKTQPWLKEICNSLGSHKCSNDRPFLNTNDVFGLFEDYSTNIEKNTILTGIGALDDKVKLTIGSLVGLLGAPGSAKTSLAMNILKNASLNNIKGLFFSMDTYSAHIYQKFIMMETRYSADKILDMFKNRTEESKRVRENINEIYKNIGFSFKSGLNVEEIRQAILDYQEVAGEKLKLVCIDYLECISGPYSDSNANSAYISNKLKDLANELGVCILLLVQPSKIGAGVNIPFKSQYQVKGSSTIVQAMTTLLACYREGFSYDNPDQDKFLTISALKNRTGPLTSVDLYWDGISQTVRNMNEEETHELEEIRNRNKDKKDTESGWG